MRFTFPLLCTLSLFCTVNEPLRCELFSGYRNDRIHWHVKTLGELYRDVEYWENGLSLKVIHRDLTFLAKGAYGTFGKGTLFQETLQLPTEGWTAEGSGYFGYAVNLTADRLYKTLLTPLVGYSAHFERLHPQNMRVAWYGFLFGAALTFETTGRLVLNAGYSYHLLHNHFQNNFLRSNSSGGGDKGHSGWAQIDYLLNSVWRLGIGAQIHYFFTGVVPSTFENHFKLRWTAISGWFQFSREF